MRPPVLSTSPAAPGTGRWFWWVAVLAGPPGAWLAARAGFGWPHGEPARDLAWLLLASVAEEIVFRGALQPALARWLGAGPVDRRLPWFGRANVATSALFAALHLWRHPAAVALAMFPLSLVYGRARELSGRWWPAAALHLWFNAALYLATGWLAATP